MAETKTVKVVLTNVANGPRGVHAVGGQQVINPGDKSAELTLTEGELASLKSSGNFAIEEKGPGETLVIPEAPERLTKLGEKVRNLEGQVQTTKALEERVAKLDADLAATREKVDALTAKLEGLTSGEGPSGGSRRR